MYLILNYNFKLVSTNEGFPQGYYSESPLNSVQPNDGPSVSVNPSLPMALANRMIKMECVSPPLEENYENTGNTKIFFLIIIELS